MLKEFEDIINKYGFNDDFDAAGVLPIIRNSIKSFMDGHQKVALYCNGQHTRTLMADFISELKKVRYIVDNRGNKKGNEGFSIIRDDEIETNGIDGIIISSYKYRKGIKESLSQNHSKIDYLDIYDELESSGKGIRNEYYRYKHPFQHYRIINELQNSIKSENDEAKRKNYYHNLIKEYLKIKDIRMASVKADECGDIELARSLKALYKKELDMASNLSENIVLLFCADGLRRGDVIQQRMPNLSRFLQNHAMQYTKAYSYSTSTYESMIPACSGNTDQKTEYFRDSSFPVEKCEFIREAKHQERDIYFYTDIMELVKDDSIYRYNDYQTLTEKIWSFVTDAAESKNGLFFIRSLYETHYSYANPYTEGLMLAEGTGILFDYLQEKGGSLRTDYIRQQADALRYFDDSITPFFECFRFPVLFFADHGNILLDYGMKLEEVPPGNLVAGEDLIQIPLVMISSTNNVGHNDELMSLLDINELVLSLLQNRTVDVDKNRRYIKIGRSEIYNPDMRYLYNKMGQEHSLLAFEGFIFKSGLKLIVYSDGVAELYLVENDKRIYDQKMIDQLLLQVKRDISVYDVS